MSKTLLIVEDDRVSRDLLRLVFEYDGYRCREAENGLEGLTHLESQTFDAIIVDNVMPVMTGLEFLAKVQRSSHHPDTPIIMLTGLLTAKVRRQATKSGAYAIVGKPYDISELRGLVSQLCEKPPPLPNKVPAMTK